MRILLGESVPVQIRNALSRHQVSTAVEMRWQGIGNGELLDRAEADADFVDKKCKPAASLLEESSARPKIEESKVACSTSQFI